MLAYLYKNRLRPRVFSAGWLKTWGKRVINIRLLWLTATKRAWFHSHGAVIGDRSIVLARIVARNAKRLTVGCDCFIDSSANLGLHGRIKIGSGVVINSGVRVITGSHNVNSPHWELVSSDVTIEDFAWVATDALILPGVTVGRGAVIGAGSVVRRDVPPMAVVIGNPAQIISSRRACEFRYSPVQSTSLFDAWLGNRFEGSE